MTAETKQKKKRSPVLLIVAGVVFFLILVCGITGKLAGPATETAATPTARAFEGTTEASLSAASVRQNNTPKPTNTPEPASTPEATNTPKPTHTPLPPTATPDPNRVRPGSYIVGADIRPGLYRGQAGYELFRSCYWARLKDLSGTLGAIIANDNSIGRYYVEIAESDYSFETRCELIFLVSLPEPLEEYPEQIMPGTYLVGRDIRPGTYKGQAGAGVTESCYWARLRDVLGGLKSIIANDNAIGQFYVQVQPGDFALSTRCELTRVGE